jgi:hypothetical protein
MQVEQARDFWEVAAATSARRLVIVHDPEQLEGQGFGGIKVRAWANPSRSGDATEHGLQILVRLVVRNVVNARVVVGFFVTAFFEIRVAGSEARLSLARLGTRPR